MVYCFKLNMVQRFILLIKNSGIGNKIVEKWLLLENELNKINVHIFFYLLNNNWS